MPFDSAQGGESFDVAQDREPVERPVARPVARSVQGPVEAFEIRDLTRFLLENKVQLDQSEQSNDSGVVSLGFRDSGDDINKLQWIDVSAVNLDRPMKMRPADPAGCTG